jgi:hypothetical protein
MKIEHEYNDKKTGVWAELVADSIWNGDRITTLVLRLPRIALAELNTHCALSRKSASSRAIPAARMRARVQADPYIPWRWPVNGKGMVPASYRDDWPEAERAWIEGLGFAVYTHNNLEALGVHKEVTNRLLEPWLFTEVLITATEWQNFFNQRCHPAAQDPIRAGAECIRDLLAQSVPVERRRHTPYITSDELYTQPSWYVEALASARRCRRVSFLKQGVAVPLLEDAREGLSGLKEDPPHMSPYEDMAVHTPGRHAKLVGWQSLRDMVETGVVTVEQLEAML